ncbi:ABC transporter ATP-binding protein [Leptothoe kymatousa TAU-MAC 1615]|uniref:ABC transporter ATP-binding protein n=1 Tax=Leptothoe kymatousa TAU-MAC 1615 TaxID=2364775 RepID=A0ABS5Y0P1_9CYAN|nr:ABC transporter ATP-binding protein [Leptothoe kymatousa TAU-MAC 1615]
MIQVENLSKKYVIGHQQHGGYRYKALRDVIADGIKKASKKFIQPGQSLSLPNKEDFWALKNISFEIKRGEVVGIIGRNGAGKSTLLKVLSRITEPTTGKIRLNGRVASLLEVGTGFHPELTGRENIFLNGAILGMSRSEINRKFDEIVDFSEVAKFLDTPVKRYSSGMYVRLAFAVAAHLEPEILVVDEVLAVGDIAFQKKCLGKMETVSGEGRTILFVSHNMQAIRNLCTRGILLDKGEIIADESIEASLNTYHQSLRNLQFNVSTGVKNSSSRRGEGQVRFTEITLLDNNNNETFHFPMGDKIRFKLSYQVFSEVKELGLLIRLRSGTTGEPITSDFHHLSSKESANYGKETIVIEWTNNNLLPGEYLLYFWLGNSTTQAYDVVDDLTHPLVVNANIDTSSKNLHPSSLLGFFSMESHLLSDQTLSN